MGWIRRLCGHIDDPVFEAVRMEDLAQVGERLSGGGRPNVKDRDGWRPLHWAAQGGSQELTGLLLTHEADVDARNRNGETPLHVAAGVGHTGMVTLLLEHGADVNAQDRRHHTPLHNATGNGHSEVAQFLLAHGADINARAQYYGRTPLLLAIQKGRADIAKLLRDRGGST